MSNKRYYGWQNDHFDPEPLEPPDITDWCEACTDGNHADCDTESCRCHCDPYATDGRMLLADLCEDDDGLGECSYTPECTCERCMQNHPERVIDMGDEFDV